MRNPERNCGVGDGGHPRAHGVGKGTRELSVGLKARSRNVWKEKTRRNKVRNKEKLSCFFDNWMGREKRSACKSDIPMAHNAKGVMGRRRGKRRYERGLFLPENVRASLERLDRKRKRELGH